MRADKAVRDRMTQVAVVLVMREERKWELESSPALVGAVEASPATASGARMPPSRSLHASSYASLRNLASHTWLSLLGLLSIQI